MIEHQGGATSKVTCDRCKNEITNKFSDWYTNIRGEDLCKHCYEQEKDNGKR